MPAVSRDQTHKSAPRTLITLRGRIGDPVHAVVGFPPETVGTRSGPRGSIHCRVQYSMTAESGMFTRSRETSRETDTVSIAVRPRGARAMAFRSSPTLSIIPYCPPVRHLSHLAISPPARWSVIVSACPRGASSAAILARRNTSALLKWAYSYLDAPSSRTWPCSQRTESVTSGLQYIKEAWEGNGRQIRAESSRHALLSSPASSLFEAPAEGPKNSDLSTTAATTPSVHHSTGPPRSDQLRSGRERAHGVPLGSHWGATVRILSRRGRDHHRHATSLTGHRRCVGTPIQGIINLSGRTVEDS